MDISALFSQVHSLPCIPRVAQDLIQQFDNPHTSLDSVARNIALDPVIAAKVLRLATAIARQIGSDLAGGTGTGGRARSWSWTARRARRICR